jgi:hypothetical protein
VLVVPPSKAVVDPYAVVVGSRDACAAPRAVLTACRLGELAYRAVHVGVEELVVVRIPRYVLGVRRRCNNVRCVQAGLVAEIGEDVRQREEEWEGEFVVPWY